MTLHIDDVRLLIPAVGLLAGYAVHKHTRTAARAGAGATAGAAAKGDAVGAIGAAAAVITVLFLLFGGGGSASAGEDSRPAGHALASQQVSEVRSA
ncbi:hypothetical protein GCM10010425_51170 [Streptomyces spororaveus]|uniref:DUF4235 domain-containing protein n=1 Tax=Streptomyces spororaveus TaxID=284039 RepID=A0ABQ3TKR5_9ACTN|nr:hypothetical protein [Streptomyces spororaveus]MCM9078703.1 hypothetical protein [Streptomyces spororaveus]GHI80978.1 hypothetical protein Sspor_65390 [Streptomyces spororaveus]